MGLFPQSRRLEQARRRGRSVVAEALLGANPQARRQELQATPALREFVSDRYLSHARATKRSSQVDETILRKHILPTLGHLTLDQIGSERIAELINGLRARGYAPGTTNRLLVLLRYIFNLARKWNVLNVGVNPTASLSMAPRSIGNAS